MSVELDLDDVAAQSPLAHKQLADLRAEHSTMIVELAVARGLLRDDTDMDGAETAEIARLRAALKDAANSFRSIYNVTGNEAALLFERDALAALNTPAQPPKDPRTLPA